VHGARKDYPFYKVRNRQFAVDKKRGTNFHCLKVGYLNNSTPNVPSSYRTFRVEVL
jgi:hypothetical protein